MHLKKIYIYLCTNYPKPINPSGETIPSCARPDGHQRLCRASGPPSSVGGIGHIWQQLGRFAQRGGEQRDKSKASGRPKEGLHDLGYFSGRFVKVFWAEHHHHSLGCWESGAGLPPQPLPTPSCVPTRPRAQSSTCPVGTWDRESIPFALLSRRMANVPVPALRRRAAGSRALPRHGMLRRRDLLAVTSQETWGQGSPGTRRERRYNTSTALKNTFAFVHLVAKNAGVTWERLGRQPRNSVCKQNCVSGDY